MNTSIRIIRCYIFHVVLWYQLQLSFPRHAETVSRTIGVNSNESFNHGAIDDSLLNTSSTRDRYSFVSNEGRNLLKQEQEAWSCQHCHDGNLLQAAISEASVTKKGDLYSMTIPLEKALESRLQHMLRRARRGPSHVLSNESWGPIRVETYMKKVNKTTTVVSVIISKSNDAVSAIARNASYPVNSSLASAFSTFTAAISTTENGQLYVTFRNITTGSEHDTNGTFLSIHGAGLVPSPSISKTKSHHSYIHSNTLSWQLKTDSAHNGYVIADVVNAINNVAGTTRFFVSQATVPTAIALTNVIVEVFSAFHRGAQTISIVLVTGKDAVLVAIVTASRSVASTIVGAYSKVGTITVRAADAVVAFIVKSGKEAVSSIAVARNSFTAGAIALLTMLNSALRIAKDATVSGLLQATSSLHQASRQASRSIVDAVLWRVHSIRNLMSLPMNGIMIVIASVAYAVSTAGVAIVNVVTSLAQALPKRKSHVVDGRRKYPLNSTVKSRRKFDFAAVENIKDDATMTTSTSPTFTVSGASTPVDESPPSAPSSASTPAPDPTSGTTDTDASPMSTATAITASAIETTDVAKNIAAATSIVPLPQPEITPPLLESEVLEIEATLAVDAAHSLSHTDTTTIQPPIIDDPVTAVKVVEEVDITAAVAAVAEVTSIGKDAADEELNRLKIEQVIDSTAQARASKDAIIAAGKVVNKASKDVKEAVIVDSSSSSSSSSKVAVDTSSSSSNSFEAEPTTSDVEGAVKIDTNSDAPPPAQAQAEATADGGEVEGISSTSLISPSMWNSQEWRMFGELFNSRPAPAPTSSASATSTATQLASALASTPSGYLLAMVSTACFLLGSVISLLMYFACLALHAKWVKRMSDYIDTLEQTAVRLLSEVKCTEAVTLLTNGIKNVCIYRGEKHFDTAGFKHLLAKAHLGLGENTTAEVLLQEVRSIYEPFGEDAHFGRVIEDLAVSLHGQKRLDQAYSLFLQSLGIYQRELAVLEGTSDDGDLELNNSHVDTYRARLLTSVQMNTHHQMNGGGGNNRNNDRKQSNNTSFSTSANTSFASTSFSFLKNSECNNSSTIAASNIASPAVISKGKGNTTLPEGTVTKQNKGVRQGSGEDISRSAGSKSTDSGDNDNDNNIFTSGGTGTGIGSDSGSVSGDEGTTASISPNNLLAHFNETSTTPRYDSSDSDDNKNGVKRRGLSRNNEAEAELNVKGGKGTTSSIATGLKRVDSGALLRDLMISGGDGNLSKALRELEDMLALLPQPLPSSPSPPAPSTMKATNSMRSNLDISLNSQNTTVNAGDPMPKGTGKYAAARLLPSDMSAHSTSSSAFTSSLSPPRKSTSVALLRVDIARVYYEIADVLVDLGHYEDAWSMYVKSLESLKTVKVNFNLKRSPPLLKDCQDMLKIVCEKLSALELAMPHSPTQAEAKVEGEVEASTKVTATTIAAAKAGKAGNESTSQLSGSEIDTTHGSIRTNTGTLSAGTDTDTGFWVFGVPLELHSS